MISVHPQYIVDEKNNPKAVIVPLAEWNALLEEIEELEDIRAYDAAKTDKDDEVIPFKRALDEIKASE